MQLKSILKRKIINKNEITLTLFLLIIFWSTVMIESSMNNDENNSINGNQTHEIQFNGVKRKRVKRFLSMRPGMRFLFRVNGREDALYDIPSWAHAYGFRGNYDIYQPLHSFPFHFINRRSVHDEVENLIELHQGLDGKACLLKTFCDATGWNRNENNKMGMLFKVFQVIFAKKTKYLDEDLDCKDLEEKCPFSLLELLPFTDI
uniref:CSON013179 protein n=1 Tax=Culicoides sonorensis TaxID=179676 RepID=A0A336M7B8_CULSO